MGTHWEQEEKPKKNSPLPHPTLTRKKKGFKCESMLSLHIGCMKFLFPKLFVTIFGLG
jgi:hypothetical protein